MNCALEPLADLSSSAAAVTVAAEVHALPNQPNSVPRADTLPRAAKQREEDLPPLPSAAAAAAAPMPTLVRSNSTGTNCSITSSDYGFQVRLD